MHLVIQFKRLIYYTIRYKNIFPQFWDAEKKKWDNMWAAEPCNANWRVQAETHL